MSDILNSDIASYLGRLDPPTDPVLLQMQAEGQKRGFPIIGPLVGQYLFLVAKMLGAKRIFELGSGFGYSTYWFASALPDDGEIHHTDGSEENSAQAREYLTQGGHGDKVTFHVGDACAALDGTDGTYDILFCDIDKHGYPEVYPRIKERLNVGGAFVCDNMLWSGSVLEQTDDASTLGIQELTHLLYADADLHTVLVPIRDGFTISYRMS